MTFGDTGFFIALIQRSDSLHRRAVAWSRYLQEPIITTDYVLLETFNDLLKPVNRPRVHRFFRNIARTGNYVIIPASPALQSAGLKLHADRPDQSWSLTDCISFIVMEERRIRRALAYDHHFEQAGYEALLRSDPPG